MSSFRSVISDPRINRQIQWLQPYGRIYTLNTAEGAIPGVPFLDCGIQEKPKWKKLWRYNLLALRQYEAFYWQADHVLVSWAKIRALKPDLIIANDVDAWPLAIRAQKQFGAKIVLDAHEFYTAEHEDITWWRLLIQPYIDYICRQCLPKAEQVITVSGLLAKYYEELYHVQAGIILNTPFYEDIQPGHTKNNKIRLIHHGGVHPDRHLEETIDLMHHLDERFDLTLMFVPNNPVYLEELKQRASYSDRIHFVAPVSMNEIAKEISQYDIGVYLAPETNRHSIVCLPNKVFEYIQARLAVALGPAYELKKLVEKFDVGVISEHHTAISLAEKLNKLTAEQINRFRLQSNQASQELCAENSGKLFLECVEKTGAFRGRKEIKY